MASSLSAVLLSNGAATGAGVQYEGGKTAIVLSFTTLPATSTTVQMLAQDGTSWIDVAVLTAEGITNIDLPNGQYRLELVGAGPVAVYCNLDRVPY